MQLCDKLSVAVNTSGSKDEPADETSPQATGNCVNVDNGSAQLAASSSNDLWVNSIFLTAVAQGSPNEITKHASDRNRSVNVLLQAERTQIPFQSKDFSGSEQVALLRRFLPLHL